MGQNHRRIYIPISLETLVSCGIKPFIPELHYSKISTLGSRWEGYPVKARKEEIIVSELKFGTVDLVVKVDVFFPPAAAAEASYLNGFKPATEDFHKPEEDFLEPIVVKKLTFH